MDHACVFIFGSYELYQLVRTLRHISCRFQQPAKRKLIHYYVAAAAAVTAGLAVISPKIMDNLRGHLENSANERVHLWRAYARMFTDHPLTGVGLFQGDKLLPETYARLGITEPFTTPKAASDGSPQPSAMLSIA